MHSDGRWFMGLINQMATALAAEIKNLWVKAPSVPDLPLSDEKAKDQAIQDFFDHLKKNSAQDNKVLAQFIYAVSAVIVDQFKAKDADLERSDLATDLLNVSQKASGIWETYRKHAEDSLRESYSISPGISIDVKKVVVHYQLDNGLLTKNKTDDQTYANRIQDHITGKTLMSPGDLVHHLLHLYLYGSRNNYNHAMSALGSAGVRPLPPDENALFNAFPADRNMLTRAYYDAMPRIETAVDAFVKAQTGTNSSINSVPALAPGAQPPAAPVNPPAAVPVVPVAPAPVNPPAAPVNPPAPAPLPLALTPEQVAIRTTVDQLKAEADQDLANIGTFETLLRNRESDLKTAVARNVLADIGKARDALWALSEFKSNTKLLPRIDAQLNANTDLEAKMRSQSQAFASQQADLVNIRDSVQKMYDDQSTGIHARERAANSSLRKLRTDSIAALRAIGQPIVGPIIAAIEAARDTIKGEAKTAQAVHVSAETEYRTFLRDRAEFQPRSKLEDELRQLKKRKGDIDAHAQTILAEQKASAAEMVTLKDYEKKKPTWWSIVGPKALSSAQTLTAEIDRFKAEVDQYTQDVDNWIADVSKNRLAIEDAKIPFKASPPDPKKYGEDRINQCNVWFHMFDADRLTRSDRYRLAQLEAHPNKPWAINFASDLDTIRVLEAAVKSGRSNKMMDLKDMPNFYKMVENLVIATCEELKMAPPQPNSMDEQMLLFVATGASLHEGVQWAYSNDRIKAWEFTRLKQVVRSQVVDPVNQKIKLPDGTDANLLTQSRHLAQSAKAPKFIRIEEAY
jgi:hypothetical protein